MCLHDVFTGNWSMSRDGDQVRIELSVVCCECGAGRRVVDVGPLERNDARATKDADALIAKASQR